jgi:SAM-dependent methyltransferase
MPRAELIIPTVNRDWESVYREKNTFDYYDMSRSHPDLAGVIKKFHESEIRKILDIGAGLGGNLFSLHENGFDVRGIDASSIAVMELKELLVAKNINIPVEQGKFERLPYPDGIFDGAICIQTLSHGIKENIKNGFGELARVIRPDGMLFITLPGRIAKNKIRYCLVKTANKIDDRVYIPTKGSEIGIPHYIFNAKLIKMHLHNFMIEDMWRDYLGYYSVLARRI